MRTRRSRSRVAFAAGILVWIASGAVFAESQALGAEVDEVEGLHDPRALAVAKRMADALAEASALRVTMEIAWDAVQDDGQTIEFGATRSVAIRRPDRARMDVVDRSGAERHFLYDGQRVVLVDDTHGVYATAAFVGDLDAMLVYVRDELRLPTPLAELLSSDLHDVLAGTDSSAWVGVQSIEGVACEHVAFRNGGVGIQIWVPREGEPFPRRIVLTYETVEGRLQFRAHLPDWESTPALPDAFFTFAPDADAEQISFRAGGDLLPPASNQEDRP